jgi:hypothetical protein
MDPIKSRSQLRRNQLAKLASAGKQPLRKGFKTYSSEQAHRSEDGIMSTATGTTQVKKVVRFSEKTRSRETLSRKDCTLEEATKYWWCRKDYQRILRQCKKKIKKIDLGEKFKGKKYCARGLEDRTKIGSVLKAQARALAMNAVFDEQLTQWNEGVFDEQAIADVYYIASSSCQLWASLVGRRDHRSLYKKSSAPHCHDHEQTNKRSSKRLEQSLVRQRAA